MNFKELWDNLSEEEKEYRRLAGRAERKFVQELKTLPWNSLTPENQLLIQKHAKQTKKIKRAKKKLEKAIAWDRKVKIAPKRLATIANKVKTSKLFCMDLEMYEHTGCITEIGVSTWDYNTDKLEVYHYIVKEHYDKRNGIYVPDNKDNFQYGNSELLSLDEIKTKVYKLVQESDHLVGHAFKNDIGFLQNIGYTHKKEVFDTQNIAPLYLLENDRHSLERVVKAVMKEEPKFLHNGGNDAYYTMKSLLAMLDLV